MAEPILSTNPGAPPQTISAGDVTVQSFIDWFAEDSQARCRVDWLKAANECTQYADNKIINEQNGDFIAKTSYFPRLINTSVGMLVRAALEPQMIAQADNTIAMTDAMTSLMVWKWDKLVSVEMKRLWFYDLIIRGMAVYHVEFDEALCTQQTPLGDARITVVSPRNIFYDKWARSSEDVKRLSVVHYVTRRDAEAKWGKQFDGSMKLPGGLEAGIDNQEYIDNGIRDKGWEALPIIEPLWCDVKSEQWIYASQLDANVLSGIGIPCQPGQFIKPPPDYLMSEYGQQALVRNKEKRCWYGSFYFGDRQLEDIRPTFTDNNPYSTTIAFPVENSPYGVGLVHHVRGAQFNSTTLDTINLRLAIDSQSRYTLINGSQVTSITERQDLQNMFDNQSPRASVIVSPKPDGQGNTSLEGIVKTIEPQPISQEFLELSKYFGDMTGILSGISDWTVGAFPASDSGVKSRLRQQSQIPQLDPLFIGVEGGHERAFNELFAILQKTHTEEMMFPDRTSFGNTQYVPMNKNVQPDSAQVYGQQGHLLADDGSGGIVVNPISLADGFKVRVRVNTMTNADKYEQVDLNIRLADGGYLPPDEVLEPHPIYSRSRKELLDKAQQFKINMSLEMAKVQGQITMMQAQLAQQMGGGQQQRPPSVSIGYPDLPPLGKVQAAAEAGIRLSPEEVMQQDAEKKKLEASKKTPPPTAQPKGRSGKESKPKTGKAKTGTKPVKAKS